MHICNFVLTRCGLLAGICSIDAAEEKRVCQDVCPAGGSMVFRRRSGRCNPTCQVAFCLLLCRGSRGDVFLRFHADVGDRTGLHSYSAFLKCICMGGPSSSSSAQRRRYAEDLPPSPAGLLARMQHVAEGSPCMPEEEA